MQNATNSLYSVSSDSILFLLVIGTYSHSLILFGIIGFGYSYGNSGLSWHVLSLFSYHGHSVYSVWRYTKPECHSILVSGNNE